MGVYVNGMKMPENCSECPCLRHDSLDGKHAYQCNVKLGIRRHTDGKPKWCPLVEVPTPHERLVEFVEVQGIKLADDGTTEISMTDLLDAYYQMRNASTVIEGEWE